MTFSVYPSPQAGERWTCRYLEHCPQPAVGWTLRHTTDTVNEGRESVAACQSCAKAFHLDMAYVLRRDDPLVPRRTLNVDRNSRGWVVVYRGEVISEHWIRRAAHKAARWWLTQ